MQLGEIYRLFINEGIREDLRTSKDILKFTLAAKKCYRELSALEKKFFDKECFTNPYADTRLLFGSPGTDIKRILVGIDIGVSEILLAQQLRFNKRPVDLVISHHPLGTGLAGLHDVMHLQVQWLKHFGLKQDIAQSLMKKRIEEVHRSVHSCNHQRTVDAAQLLNISLMCCHTPADNHVARYLQQKMDHEKPKTLKNVIAILLREPEYQIAARQQAGPMILSGKQDDPAGKIMIDMTGGTEGSQEIFARLSQAGVKTIIGMHMSEKHFAKVKNEHLNVVIAGHIASDNLGLNLLFDKLVKADKALDICSCSGFRRVCR